MTVTLHALAEQHIPQILEACQDWEELAQYGPPYWRPRSSAELRRKIADTAGPQPATAYTFVLADDSPTSTKPRPTASRNSSTPSSSSMFWSTPTPTSTAISSYLAGTSRHKTVTTTGRTAPRTHR